MTLADAGAAQSVATLWAAVIGSLAAITAAVLGALNAARARRWTGREQWWARFRWAAEKAVSTGPGQSELGLSVLTALVDAPWAREEDDEMALAVASVIVANAPAPAVHAKKTWWGR